MPKFLFTIFLLTIFSNSISQVVVLQENFQNPNALSNWTIINNDGFTPNEQVAQYTDAWILTTDPADANDTVVSATSFFTIANRADRWLISPKITLGAYGNYLSWKAKSFEPSFPEDYKILISKTGNTPTDFQDTVALFIYENYNWQDYDFNIEEFANQDVYIAFVLTTYDGNRLFLDDISVRIEDQLSLIKNTKENSIVYPNPTKTTLTFSHDLDKPICITSLDGKELYKSIENSDILDVQFLESGTYILTYSFENKLIKQVFTKN